MTRNINGNNELQDLPDVDTQVGTLIGLGVHRVAGLTALQLRAAAQHLTAQTGLLAVHSDVAPASVLAPMLSAEGKPGFVVSDMTDVDEFSAIDAVSVPAATVYLVQDPRRGDEMVNWSPDEALPAILDAGRTPLTLTEGIQWLSNGTGRDGKLNRDAPKVGWCWAGNRHTWLGFASAAGRHAG